MKRIEVLNEKHRKLTSDNLDVVKWAVLKHIGTREEIPGLGYDDLFQEGCLCLMRAAVTYDSSTLFTTYAGKVVRNGLISYCRKVNNRHKKFSTLPFDDIDDAISLWNPTLTSAYNLNDIAHNSDILHLLKSIKSEYTGTALLGIESLELKIKGFTGADIAEMHGVKPNLVGAWITRAAQKLRRNERFISALREVI